MISAIVFIFWPEEELYLTACLESISWADEIIIIDNGATEKTLNIARKYTKHIFKCEDKSFAERHNLGKEKAKGDWLLYIDADERISEDLQNEIKIKVAIDATYDAYELNRINFFLGKKVRFGDRFPDYVTRIFKRKSLVRWTGDIHESSEVSGRVGKLEGAFFHLTHRDIFSMMSKTINFSEHEAFLRLKVKHPPVVWWRLLRVFISEFYKRIIIMQGWRQGTEGWIDGMFQAFSMFVVYARLWEMQRTVSLGDTYQEIDNKILKGKI